MGRSVQLHEADGGGIALIGLGRFEAIEESANKDHSEQHPIGVVIATYVAHIDS